MKKWIFCGMIFLNAFCACDLFEVKRTDESLAQAHAQSDSVHRDSIVSLDTLQARGDLKADSLRSKDSVLAPPTGNVDTKNVQPGELVAYAQTLMGTPYKYASTDPKVGFDCSGFITYVFNHFGIAVPRSSIDFTNVGKAIPDASARPGDLILFTGTDSTERFVGHMGIVVSNNPTGLQFIHSSSGKANGVTITPLNDYYRGRYVKTIRIFPQNDRP